MSNEQELLASISVPMPSADIGPAAQRFLQQAQSFELDCAEMKPIAVDEIRKITEKWDALEELRKHFKKPIDEAAKRIQEFFVPKQTVLLEAKQILRKKLDVFINEEERVAKIAATEARKKAEEEAKALSEKAAEQARLGNLEEARAMHQEAEMMPAIAALSSHSVAKTSGAARKENWSASVTDKMALIKSVCGMDILLSVLESILKLEGLTPEQFRAAITSAVANHESAHKTPLAAIEANPAFLNAQARALKSELRYPGVQAVMEKSSSIRR